jgi:hypothetical protein
MAGSTSRVQRLIAVIGALIGAGLFLGFATLWLWPLGQFGEWQEHWPYLWDGLLGKLPGHHNGTRWHQYQAYLAQHGVLDELYARLIGLSTLSVGVGLYVFGRLIRPAVEGDTHQRGLQYLWNHRLAVRLARQHARSELRQEHHSGVHVHPAVQLTAGRENLGILAVGAQGSGKTQFLLPIVQQVCEAIENDASDQDFRAVLFDYKGEYTEVLPVEDDRFMLIAPWDQRSAHWAIGQDVRTRGDARLIAEQLISDSKDPMWSNASRQVLTGLIHALALTKPGRWDFPDLADLLSAGGNTLIEALTVGNREAVRLVSNPEDNKTAQSILANLAAFMAPITDLAEAWRSEPTVNTPCRDVQSDAESITSFSIQGWLAEDWTGPRIVVIQGSSRYEPLMQAFLRSFLGVLIARIIDPAFPEARSRDTDYRLFVFLDEFIRLGPLPDIEKLITVGRSKGVRLLLGLQDIAQVRHVYGPDRAAAWFSQLATQFYGRVAPGDTALWLSHVFAKEEVEHTVYTASKPAQGGLSETVGWRPLERPVLMPGQLSTELSAGPNGVIGLLHCTGWGHVYRLRWPITRLPRRRDAAMPALWTQPARDSTACSRRSTVPTPVASPALPEKLMNLSKTNTPQPAKPSDRTDQQESFGLLDPYTPQDDKPTREAESVLNALREILQPHRLNKPADQHDVIGWVHQNEVLLVGRSVAKLLRNHRRLSETLKAMKANAAIYDWLLTLRITEPSPFDDRKPIAKIKIRSGDWQDEQAVIRLPIRRLWSHPDDRPSAFNGSIDWINDEVDATSAPAR